METQNGHLERFNEFHTTYFAYQYPLLFPYGEDRYKDDVLHQGEEGGNSWKRNKLTIRWWLSFILQTRKFEATIILCARRLFQQFFIDGNTMTESFRLSWLRKNQSKLRVGKYKNLNDNQTNVGA